MNELTIFTERGIYSGGEIVYGAIYLKIIRPTGISKLILKLKGVIKDEFDTFNHKESIVKNEYEVCKFDTPFPIGYYAFPFKVTLPVKLPGTILVENASGPKYRIETSYWLTAHGANSRCLRSKIPLVIYQNDDQAPMVEPPCATELLSVSILPGIFKGDVCVNARMNKPVFEFGEQVSLDIYIKNETRRTIESIVIKLIRCLEVRISETGDRQNIESILWGRMLPGSDADVIERYEDVVVHIPLPSAQEFSPTVSNKYFKCFHRVEITVAVETNRSLCLKLPIGCVLPNDNLSWSSWRQPYWLDRCSISPVASPVKVPQAEMSSLHFASVPVLRHLSAHFL